MKQAVSHPDGVAERVVSVVALAAVLFIALAMTGTLPLSAPHQAGATQYCTQYEYNPGCQPLVPPLIAFSSTRDAGGNTEVYVMNADGAAQTRIFANNSSIFDGQPSWRPDGQKLAFVSARDGNNEIYTMNLDGSGQTRLTSNTASDVFPAWSPDGSKIAFESLRDGNAEIYVMNADGTAQTRLTSNTAFDGIPAWSPDGSKIAFVSGRTVNDQIWVMNPDGSGQTRLTADSADDSSPAWSPDGTKIAFSSDAGGLSQIYVMNADGSGVTRLTNDSSIDGTPTWSPDGTKIAFTHSSGNNINIWVMNADGSGPAALTNDFALDTGPTWQPGPPGAPTGVSATAGAGKATVSFVPPALLGGASIVRYTATATPGDIQAFSTGGPIVVHGLTNGQSYTFTVTASNLAGTGPPSAPSNAVTPEPLDLTATFENPNNSIYVPGTWTNMPVTVTFFCTDVGGPGVASLSAPVVVSAEGVQNVTGSCTDNGGNTITQSFGPIQLDRTPPTLTATITNTDGSPYVPGTSTNQNVTIAFTCSDPGGSGIASVSAPTLVTTVGGGQFRQGFCTDNAGNVASLSVGPIQIDRTAPTVGASFKNADGSPYAPNTWTNQSVIVTFTCVDSGGSGVASLTAPVTLQGEGNNLSAAGSCTDNAGNTATRLFNSIEIDRTPPLLTATFTNADGSAYVPGTWTNQNVTVTFHCTDTLSGVASTTAPTTLTAEGAGQSVTGFCTDRAGNVSADPVGGIQIDKTPPVLTATYTNADGSTYLSGTFTNQTVTVTFGCTDSASGVASVTAPVVFSVTGTSSTTGFCTDNAGNVGALSTQVVDIDKAAPVLGAQPRTADGALYQPGTWTNQSVTVTFSCTDTGGSGVASFSSPLTFTSEGANQAANGFCLDNAGNLTTTAVVAIDIDKTPPLLTATFMNADGSAYTPGTATSQSVVVTFACSDPLSGVASFSAPVTVSSEGANQSVTGMCTDNAGLTVSESFGPIDIDETPPEAYLVFDPAADALRMFGTDSGGSGTGSSPILPSGQSYTIVDGAGNTLVIVLQLTSSKGDAQAAFVSFRYNGGPPIAAPANTLHFTWTTTKTGALKSLTQDLLLGSGRAAQHVVATYNSTKNETTIKVTPGKTTKVTGLALVKVVTSSGALSFQY